MYINYINYMWPEIILHSEKGGKKGGPQAGHSARVSKNLKDTAVSFLLLAFCSLNYQKPSKAHKYWKKIPNINNF